MLNRESLLLVVFSLLAIATVGSSYQWMDTHHSLDSEQALEQAQHLADRLNDTGRPLQLTDISSPSRNRPEWRISYRQSHGKRLTISVQENGQARLI